MFGIYNDYYDKNGNCVKTLIDGPALCGVYRGKPFQEHFDVLASYYLVATKMLRRACIEAAHLRFPERTLGEDGLFYVAFMRQNPSCLVAIQKPLYHYTFARSASLSTPGIRSGCRTILFKRCGLERGRGLGAAGQRNAPEESLLLYGARFAARH